MIRRLALCAVLTGAALAGPAACAGDAGTPRATAPGRGGRGGTGLNEFLVGQWSRTVIFTTAGGDAHMSRTVWDFGANGAATRTVIATNLTEGIADTLAASARWTTNGSAVTVEFLPPNSGIVTFDFHVDGMKLTLGGLEFTRTS